MRANYYSLQFIYKFCNYRNMPLRVSGKIQEQKTQIHCNFGTHITHYRFLDESIVAFKRYKCINAIIAFKRYKCISAIIAFKRYKCISAIIAFKRYKCISAIIAFKRYKCINAIIAFKRYKCISAIIAFKRYKCISAIIAFKRYKCISAIVASKTRKAANFSLFDALTTAKAAMYQPNDPKYVVNTSRAESLWIHWPYKIKPNTATRLVPSTEGRMLHFHPSAAIQASKRFRKFPTMVAHSSSVIVAQAFSSAVFNASVDVS
uniref:Glycosyltransferase family 92 protein n=1 Tax=Globodera rostochiensis TaxID=31243 RepID=A0A914H4V6_GLORO